MKILALDSRDVFGTDGSGNQVKMWLNKQYLIKVNSKYREASKEVDAYKLGKAMGLNCVEYREQIVEFRGNQRKACITKSFLLNDEIEVTVAEILDTVGVNIPMNMSSVDYINITVNEIAKYTGIEIESVYKWVYDMLIFDYIICNDDRHLSNFEVIYNKRNKYFRLAPYYDHGESFFRTDANLSIAEYEKLERKFKSKPFSSNPDKNIGEYRRAVLSYESMMRAVGGVAGIKGVGLSSGHLSIVLRRIKRLESKIRGVNK